MFLLIFSFLFVSLPFSLSDISSEYFSNLHPRFSIKEKIDDRVADVVEKIEKVGVDWQEPIAY